jgi:hypothetical protein
MSAKYQIFVSSTFDDLKVEREQVIKAILEMGHIPVGMEMFSAADEEQWKLIARQIDETDYYVIIVGHRYGSMTGGVSFTEKEFDYAITKGVPVYGFEVDKEIQPLAKNVDSDAKKKLGLSKFKMKVRQRPVSFWKNADDLHGKVSIALMKAFTTTPRIGWTRTPQIAGPEVTQELSRLSKENSELREQLVSALQKEVLDQKVHLLAQIDTLKAIPKQLSLKEHGSNTWNLKVTTTLFKIFSSLAPELMVEKSTKSACHYLSIMFKPEGKTLAQQFAFASNNMKNLLVDFASMDLIEPSNKKHPISDKEEYWCLSMLGRQLLKLDRSTQLELVAASAIKRKAAKE